MIHPTAIIETEPNNIADATIWAWVHIMSGVKIGVGTSIGERVFIGKNVTIGKNCRIQAGAFIPEGVIIRDNVFIGPNVTFTNVKRPVPYQKAIEYEKTLICSGVVIGANATILCGLTLAVDCFIGAGAVVTKNVAAGQTVIGNPARPL